MANDTGLTLRLDNADDMKSALNNLDRLLSGFDKALNQTAGALDTFDRNLIRIAKDANSTNSQLLALTKTMGSFDASISKIAPTISKLADDLSRGLANGALTKGFTDIASKAGNAFLDTLRKIWGIRSPSIVMASFADFLQEGFISHVQPQEYGKAGSDAGGAFVQGFDQATDKPFKALALKLKQRGQELIQTGIQEVLRGGIAAFLQGELVSQVGDFDQVLNQIRVYGKLTSDQVKSVQNDILKFAEVSQFNPQQVATAFLGLQKAGLSARESLSTLPPIIDLATAGQIDLARATDLTIRTAQGLGIPFSEATRVVNAFVAGADISTANVEDFGQALQFIAPSARNLHIPIEQLTTAIALLNDQGIVGERAGTGLRAALDSLIAPSSGAREALQALGVRVKDAKGNFVGFPNLLEQFATSIDKLRKRGAGDAQIVELLSKLGDRNTAQAILALTARTNEGGLAFADYAKKLGDANTAQDIAAEQMKTFNGVVESFKGSIQSLIIKAFQPLLDNILAPLIKIATDVVNALAEIPQPILNIAAAVSLAASAFVTLQGALKIADGALLLITGGGLETLGAALGGLVSILFDPIGLIVGFGTLAATVALAVPVLAALGAAIYVAVQIFQDFSAQVENNVGGIGDAFRELVNNITGLFQTVFGIFEEFGRLVGDLVQSFNRAFGQKIDTDTSGLVLFLRSVSSYIENIRKGLENVRQLLALINAVRGNDGGTGAGIDTSLQQRRDLNDRLTVLDRAPIENEIERLNLVRERARIEGELQKLQNAPTNANAARQINTLLYDRGEIIKRLGILTGDSTKGLIAQGKTQQNYVVKNNDTLYALAKKYGTTVEELKKLNNITDPRALRTGSTIKIPVTLTDEKEAIKQQLAEIAKNLPGGGIDLPLDADSLAARFAAFAKSDLFRNIFGDVDLDGAIVQIAQLEKTINDLADTLIHFRLDKLLPDTISLTGLKNLIENGLTALGNITDVDTSGVRKFIEAHIPSTIDLTALKKAFEAGLQTIFGGGGGVEPGFGKEYAKQAGFDPGATLLQRVIGSFNNINLDDLKKTFEDNFGKILTVLISAAAVVFGGPIGAAIGVAKLVVLAIGEDFLGVGTKLKESGLLDDISKAFEDIKKAIDDTIAEIFGGKKKKTAGDSILPFDPNAVDPNKVLTPLQLVLHDLAGLPKNLGTTFKELGEGLTGFFSELSKTDTSGVIRVLEVVGGFLGGIGTLIIRGAAKALPSIGGAIRNFIEIFSNIGKGDFGGAVGSLLKIVGDLISTIVNFSKPAADAVIDFINKLFGIKAPNAEEALGGALNTINLGFLALQITVENAKRGIEDFFREIYITFLKLQSFGQTGKAFDDLKAQIDALEADVKNRKIGTELAESISNQLANGKKIDISKFIGLDPEKIAAQLSTTQRGAILAGIQQAFESGDQKSLDLLLPIAAQPQFNQKDLSASLQTELNKAIADKNIKAISAILPFAPKLKLDTTNIPKDIQQALADAADDASNLASVGGTSGGTGTPGQATTETTVSVPITVTPEITLELDPKKFDANLGKFLADTFKGGANRDELIAAVQKYAALNPENAASVVDAFLKGVTDSLKTSVTPSSVNFPAALSAKLFDPSQIDGDSLNNPGIALTAQAITDALQAGIDNALSGVDLSKIGKTGNILDPELLQGLGISVTDGIGEGIKTGSATLTETVNTVTQQSIIDEMNDKLGIHSPSDYGILVGESLLEGIGIGLTDFLYLVQDPIGTITDLFYGIGKSAEDARDRTLGAVGATGAGLVVPILIITGLTRLYADAWQLVADNATKAENAIRNAIKAGNGGNNPTGAGTPPPGMAKGGNVYAGNVYRIFDTNNPEIYSTPNGTYLLPAQNGMITPITGGSNTVTNNNSYDYAQPINVTVNAAPGADLQAIEQAARAGVEAAQSNKPKIGTRLINAGAT